MVLLAMLKPVQLAWVKQASLAKPILVPQAWVKQALLAVLVLEQQALVMLVELAVVILAWQAKAEHFSKLAMAKLV